MFSCCFLPHNARHRVISGSRGVKDYTGCMTPCVFVHCQLRLTLMCITLRERFDVFFGETALLTTRVRVKEDLNLPHATSSA